MLSPTSGILRTGARRSIARAATNVSRRSAPQSAFERHSSLNAAARTQSLSTTRSLGYVANTNPNPPLGKKNASKEGPTRVALIGARGYTGQALIELLNAHPYIELAHVSSRELAGQKLEGYAKGDVTYENLSVKEVGEIESSGKVDAWVMALPNGVCKPFVDAIDQAKGKSVIVDVGADYRFEQGWTYGLPGESSQ